MTDAERRVLTVGQVVYYLDDQGVYWGVRVEHAPQLDHGVWSFAAHEHGDIALDRVIGRDLADVDAHKITRGWDSEFGVINRKMPGTACTLSWLRDQIADAIRAGEARGAAK